MKVLLLYDKIWAWYFKAMAIQKHLGQGHGFKKIAVASNKWIRKNPNVLKKYNHIHYFGWLDGRQVALKYKGVTAGVSSHNYFYRHWDIARNVMNRYGALTCTSKIIYDDLKKRKLGKLLYLCQNGVDEEKFQPDPVKHDKFVVGWMGQPTHGKFSRSDKSIDMHGYQHVLQPLVESMRGNRAVEFNIIAKTYKNAISHDAMVKWYNGLDLFLHTGFGTGTPNGVFEAMACGVPCISTAIGAAPEVIEDGVNGYLVQRFYNKNEALSRAKKFKSIILNVASNRCNETGENARKTIEQSWTWKQRAEAWAEVFRNHKRKL